MSEAKNNNKGDEKDVNTSLHELLLKQQALLLQQSDYITRENHRKKEEGEEIDLSYFFPSFLKKKKGSGGVDGESGVETGFLERQLNLLFRSKLLLTGFLLMGIIYSIVLYYSEPKMYQSTMTVASGYFDNTYYASLLYPLENLSQSNSYRGLAKTLKLDTVVTKKLVNLRYRDFLSKDQADSKNDSTLEVINRPYFKIDVTVSDNAILEKLQEGIFNYMNNNVYVNKQLELRRVMLKRSVEESRKEASWLDTLKVAIIRSLDYDKGSAPSSAFQVKETENRGEILLSREDKIKVEAVELFNKSQELGNNILKTEGELMQLNDNLQTVGDFSANSAPASLSLQILWWNSIYALLWGIALVYAVALFRYLNSASTK